MCSVSWTFHTKSLQKIKPATDWHTMTAIKKFIFLPTLLDSYSLNIVYCDMLFPYSICIMLAVRRMHLPQNKHIPKALRHWATLLFHVSYCRSARGMTCFTVCYLIALLLGFTKIRWAWLKFTRKQCCTKLLFFIFSLLEDLNIFLRSARVFFYIMGEAENCFQFP